MKIKFIISLNPIEPSASGHYKSKVMLKAANYIDNLSSIRNTVRSDGIYFNRIDIEIYFSSSNMYIQTKYCHVENYEFGKLIRMWCAPILPSLLLQFFFFFLAIELQKCSVICTFGIKAHVIRMFRHYIFFSRVCILLIKV